ncbi:MAG TPA: hypothetical protein DCZ94_17465 [Lentisphaeria bacterium]|nr:MAG: hypothetical protein A2X48_13345 [Lentisphaerae bacterium GWF2_49_21]HBC88733.1 hypothetical protein [Lentisphaeria bacterium]
MPYAMLDRDKLKIKPLKDRYTKVNIERDHLTVDSKVRSFKGDDAKILKETADRIKKARKNKKSVMLTFGAHSIKNGLGPVLIKFIEDGWVTHLATNGAGIIHDWESAYQSNTSEDVGTNVKKGEFGIWQETGFFINLAIVVGAYEGLGYGESVGKMIQNECLNIPDSKKLKDAVMNIKCLDKSAAAADLLFIINKFSLAPGKMKIYHPFKKYSVQAAAYRLGVSFTGHPMFGHDIIYNHPMNHGAAIGRTALRDFLVFAKQVSNLDGGVYMSVGSAVMSPMIFEKSLSMSQNLCIQKGKHIDNHFMLVVDLAKSTWDWSKVGEPPMDNPSYYLRYCKTFSRMGGTMRFLSADNRDFLINLYRELSENI